MSYLSRSVLVFTFSMLVLVATDLTVARASDKAAPSFTLKDHNGKQHSLAEYKGKFVVLEWYNRGCPFVKKFYDNGKMQELQKNILNKGAIWLTIISSAPGKQGHMTADEIKSEMKAKESSPAAVLIDESGEVGKKYAAKTTPHMFIIDPKQNILYEGAIDDQPDTEASSLKDARNYVQEGLELAMAGKEIKVKKTTAYGCAVKYQ